MSAKSYPSAVLSGLLTGVLIVLSATGFFLVYQIHWWPGLATAVGGSFIMARLFSKLWEMSLTQTFGTFFLVGMGLPILTVSSFQGGISKILGALLSAIGWPLFVWAFNKITKGEEE